MSRAAGLPLSDLPPYPERREHMQWKAAERCPECRTILVAQEGCLWCPNCNYNKCD